MKTFEELQKRADGDFDARLFNGTYRINSVEDFPHQMDTISSEFTIRKAGQPFLTITNLKDVTKISVPNFDTAYALANLAYDNKIAKKSIFDGVYRLGNDALCEDSTVLIQIFKARKLSINGGDFLYIDTYSMHIDKAKNKLTILVFGKENSFSTSIKLSTSAHPAADYLFFKVNNSIFIYNNKQSFEFKI